MVNWFVFWNTIEEIYRKRNSADRISVDDIGKKHYGTQSLNYSRLILIASEPRDQHRPLTQERTD